MTIPNTFSTLASPEAPLSVTSSPWWTAGPLGPVFEVTGSLDDIVPVVESIQSWRLTPFEVAATYVRNRYPQVARDAEEITRMVLLLYIGQMNEKGWRWSHVSD